MTKTDLKRILKLLGSKGARAGLLASNIEVRSLRAIARRSGFSVEIQTSREDLIDHIVGALEQQSLKPLDELMRMSFQELEAHFAEVGPSNEELLKLMKQLDYKVSAEDKRHLRRFAARQITETALFSSVASREGS